VRLQAGEPSRHRITSGWLGRGVPGKGGIFLVGFCKCLSGQGLGKSKIKNQKAKIQIKDQK
jgi:hypothetical protein